jgi:hypothetical protein
MLQFEVIDIPRCVNKTTFSVVLENKNWSFTIRRNFMDSGMYLDVSEIGVGPRVKGIRLGGGFDLFYAYGLFDLGFLLLANVTGSGEDPTHENIHTDYYFLYLPISELPQP